MYNPEEDIIPQELLDQALAISKTVNYYKVYFDKDNGELLAITNEDSQVYTSFIEVEYDVVKDFLTGKKNSTRYKVVFVDQTTPRIILKTEGDVSLISIEEAVAVSHWDSTFTIENYPLKQQWGFQLRPDQRVILRNHNLNTTFEVFIVDKSNSNYLYRSIKILLKDVLDNDRIYIPHVSEKEASVDMLRVFVKKFFPTVGYQVLYDTES